jgi:hypothetical protein
MNWIKSSKQQVMYQAASILLIISMVFGWVFGINVPKAYACYTWQVGQRVGLKGGAEIRYGSGFAYAVHTIVPNDNWQVDIIGGPRYADGQEWWDISREALDGGGTGWVYKAQAGYDICQPPSPGNIYVASGLELQPDPNHSWPPYEGDKLIGRFTLGNNGGQTVHLEGYGVRMRRNGSEYWDFLNMSGRDLGPGQTVRFDQNNERPLATGHYRAEITWKVSGQDWQVADAREFDVSARPGNIYVASGLELQPDPNHSWPPYEGDKLIGRFTLGNNGGQTVHLEGYGVRMRRNGSEYWDFLNMSGRDLGPGQTVRFDQNNERPLTTGHYRAEITWKVSEQDWQVADAREFDVSARPGNIYVASGLELQPDPNHSWPPYEGDKLIGRFTLGNNGGQTVHLEGYGVRMRRNGSEYWDFLNMSGRDLGPGQTVRFDQNNERPLVAGHYRAEITWKASGQDWQVADAQEFDVAARPGNIYVASGLELQPDPNHAGPPREGDKLIGRFTLGNNGGQTIHLEGYGVRMRRNGSEYWDFLNMAGRDLGPGQTVRFDQNNERPLVAGHYRAEITWKASGQDWRVADAYEFDVGTTPLPPPPSQQPNITLVQPLSVLPSSPNVNENVVGSFTIRNDGSTNLGFLRIGIGGRGPLGTDIHDFPWHWNVTVVPGAQLTFTEQRAFAASGNYVFFPVYQSSDGIWHEIYTPGGARSLASIEVSGPEPSPTSWQMVVRYEGEANRILNVDGGTVTQQSDGKFILSNFTIENRSILCRQFRMRINGVDIPLHAWNWGVIMPGQKLSVNSWSDFPLGGQLEIITSKSGDTPASAFIVGLCNLSASAFASATGEIYEKSESSDVDALYAEMDELSRLANAANIPVIEIELIVADLFSGRIFKAFEKIASFNQQHPGALQLFIKGTFGWDFSQEVIDKALKLGKLIELWNLWLQFSNGGKFLWAWAFGELTESRTVITVQENAWVSGYAVGDNITTLDNLVIQANPGNWAAVQNGGRIVQTSGQIAYAEQIQLIDSSYTTAWAVPMSLETGRSTIIELASGRPVSLTSIKVHPGPIATYSVGTALRTFHVETSLDGLKYRTILSSEFDGDELYATKIFPIASNMAQFIRFTFDSAQDPNSPTVMAAEIEAYGTPGPAWDRYEPDGSSDLAPQIPTDGAPNGPHTFSFPGDQDWIRFEAVAGKEYTLITSDLGPNADTILELYDQDATTFLLADDDSGGEALASQIIWTAPASGIYYLLVRQYNSDIGGSGTNYNLSISQKGRGGTVYLPVVLKNSDGTVLPPAKVLSGVVTDRSIPVVGTEILLRYYDGSVWSTYATTTTGANGYYQFANLPNIGAEQSMYVRWNNTNYDPSRLWLWRCWYITSSNLDDPNAYQCNFDLENTELLSPNPGATVSLPYTFTWNRRAITTDSYELNLADMNSDDLWWWTDPPLGYVDNYTLNSLPAGFVPGQQYGWWLWVYGPGGYGVSYYYYTITFSNVGTGLEIQAMPAGHRAMEDMESFAPPISR